MTNVPTSNIQGPSYFTAITTVSTPDTAPPSLRWNGGNNVYRNNDDPVSTKPLPRAHG
jgi:hypothetical protein